MRFLQQLRVLMTPLDKFRFLLVVAVMGAAALMELAGIGVLLPVAAVFLNPEWLEHDWIRQFSAVTGIAGRTHLVMAGLVLLIAVFTIKTLIASFAVWLQARFILGKQRELASRLYLNYLEMPFQDGCRSSVARWNGMLGLVENLCYFILMPAMTVLADLLVIAVLAGVLLVLMPWIALGGGGFMLIVGAIIAGTMKRLNARQGKQLLESGIRLSQVRLDGLNSYKYLKVSGGSSAFVERFYREYG